MNRGMTKKEAKERIKKILAYMESLDADEEEVKDIDALKTAIKALDGRKTGKWILCGDEDNGNAMYKCSLCSHSDIQAKSQKVPYCWWCGAEMKGCADMKINRMNCEYRHDNGNCLKVGGFCTSVDDNYCLKAESADKEGAEE